MVDLVVVSDEVIGLSDERLRRLWESYEGEGGRFEDFRKEMIEEDSDWLCEIELEVGEKYGLSNEEVEKLSEMNDERYVV